MKTIYNTQEERINALPKCEYGDLCYDYFGKGSVIVFGNIADHREQLEAIGGKYSERLKYSPLQNGRKWTEKQGRTTGYYFTSKQSKEQAVKYVQTVNHTIFDKYEQEAAKLGDLIQTRADFKEGYRVRTLHGLGTVTAHEPEYNKANTIVVKLDKFTYNYGWKGMPHTFIECRVYDVVILQKTDEIEEYDVNTIRVNDRVYNRVYGMATVLGIRTNEKGVKLYRIKLDQSSTDSNGDEFNEGEFVRDGITKNFDAQGREILHNAQYYREMLQAEYWGNEPRRFFFNIGQVNCTHCGEWWNISRANGKGLQQQLTIDELAEVLAAMYSDDQKQAQPSCWITAYTAEDFSKLQSKCEIHELDRDVMGCRFRSTVGGVGELQVFVADYAGNEAHALYYIWDEWAQEVKANVRSLDFLRSILTEGKGWARMA